jgi:hypothetical protein
MTTRSPNYPDISDLLARKEAGRRDIAAKSFSEKIEILEDMRRRVAPIRETREARRALQAEPPGGNRPRSR